KGTLNEGRLTYPEVFAKIREMLDDAQQAEGVKIYAAGQPVLVGWVHSYLVEVIQIFFLTAAILMALLVVYFRRFYAILIPLIGITISSIWGLGVISLLGYNLDPLTMVIPFLVSARALSHGVQLVQRYNDELEASETGSEAARRTFEGLFRPGSLGVVSDATGIFLISLGSIPINTKLAHYASLWALSVVVTVLIAVPLMLSLIPKQKVINNRRNPIMRLMSMVGNHLVVTKTSVITLVSLLIVTIIGCVYASRVQIGESEPGSPILYRNHDYNVSAKAINELFPGSEELIVVARTDESGGMKRPEVLRAIKTLQTYMMTDPDVGGVKALPALVEQVNRLIHSDDPRWLYIPDDPAYAGGLLFTYMASSPIPGALQEFVSPDEDEASIVFFYKDHQGTTIRRAIHMLTTWINDPANQVEGLRFELAGGLIGVTAAGNEAAFETNITVLPLVLLLIFVFVTIFYMTFHSGFLMFVMMTFATTLTYAYMGVAGIGINTNTVPIIAIGVGVGIDYSIYMMDRIREMMDKNGNNLDDAIRSALRSAGLAICFTATTLICGVIIWTFVSSLRFQADAALLLSVMLALNAIAALFLVPSWIRIFKPKFITQQNVNRVM
ncbi:MAG: MMPL family transporter, partial [Parvularculales bacterium]